MHPVAVTLNIVLSAIVFITIVGGLVWAILTSRGHLRPAAGTRVHTDDPRPSHHPTRPGEPRQPGSRDRRPAMTV